jgi:hypothetical protein
MSRVDRITDMLWREKVASRFLGEQPVAKASGGYMVERLRRTFPGWLYIGSDALVFIADEPIFERDDLAPGANRILRVVYADAGRTRLTAAFGMPNGIVKFANGGEFMGQKKHMKTLHKIASGQG